MRWLRAHLTYANIVATLVLLIVVGGGAYAASAQLAGEQQITACVVKKGPAKGDVRIISKGTCKRSEKSVVWNQTGPAGPAGATGPAGSADTPAQVLAKLLTVDGSGSGLDADTLDGLGNDTWHAVGGSGEPAFQNGWANAGLGTDPANAAFTKDATGVVHLRGQISGGTVSPSRSLGAAFTLPEGFRPPSDVYFPALTTNGSNGITAGWVAVAPTGEVFVGVGDHTFVPIDFSFRP
jgi:hypothetical protein